VNLKTKVALLFGLALICALPVTARQAFALSAPPRPFAIAQAQAASKERVIEGKVVKVSDGDTITVLDRENNQHKIRFQGIDAPESKQAFGQASKENLSNMIFGKEVKVVWSKTDKYGRTVGKILLDGRDINIEQIKAGYAWHYKSYEREQPPEDRVSYAAAEQDARAAKRGLWQDPNPTPPGEWRADAKTERWGEAPPEGTVIGNKNNKNYHRPDCPGYRSMAENNRVFFKSVEEAEAAGYKRAGNCPAEVITRKTTPKTGSTMPATATSASTTTSTAAVTTPAASSTSAQAATTASEATPAAGGSVIGNKNSKIYHRPDCPGYKSVSEKNQARFGNVSEAEAAGYRAAKNCPAPK
jgi:endonuclease YncB( thermonuclease family)/methylphosphotriester-DNA--protein-cysteine methyltransferase